MPKHKVILTRTVTQKIEVTVDDAIDFVNAIVKAQNEALLPNSKKVKIIKQTIDQFK